MDKLTDLLQQLASQLGTTVEYLWKVLIKQANVQIQINSLYMNWELGLGILLMVCFIIAIVGLFLIKDEAEIQVALGWLAFLIFIVIIITGIFYWNNYTQNITLRTNPEYWALQEILNKLGK